MVPVKNEDLWRRVDRALNFHELECRRWRLDESHGSAGSPAGRKAAESTERNDRRRRDSNLGKAAAMVRTGLRWCGRAVGGDRVDYPARRPARMAC